MAAPTSFHGEKIKHAFSYTRIGKRTAYDRDGTSVDLKDAVFRVKLDGSCGFIKWDKKSKKYIPYCRHDIKFDAKANDWDPRYLKNNGDGTYTPCDDSYIPCEPNPGAQKGYHWPHWRPVTQKTDKWFHAAFIIMMNDYDLEKFPKESFTCEYMGQKINKNTTDPLPSYVNCAIIPHNMSPHIDITNPSYDGLLNFFMNDKIGQHIEGLVAYCLNGTRYKIRRDMFYHDGNVLKWPNGISPFENFASQIFHSLLKKQKLSVSE